MKVKHIKETRKALKRFIKKVEKLDDGVIVNMGNKHECMFATIMKYSWSSAGVKTIFSLHDLTSELREAVKDLFLPTESLFPITNLVTKNDWLNAAQLVLCRLKYEIKLLEHDEYVLNEGTA